MKAEVKMNLEKMVHLLSRLTEDEFLKILRSSKAFKEATPEEAAKAIETYRKTKREALH